MMLQNRLQGYSIWILFHQGERVNTEDTQHQGICLMTRNRLMALDVSGSEYRYAACGKPYVRNGKTFLPVKRIMPANEGIMRMKCRKWKNMGYSAGGGVEKSGRKSVKNTTILTKLNGNVKKILDYSCNLIENDVQ